MPALPRPETTVETYLAAIDDKLGRLLDRLEGPTPVGDGRTIVSEPRDQKDAGRAVVKEPRKVRSR